jgi:hypothetical protein
VLYYRSMGSQPAPPLDEVVKNTQAYFSRFNYSLTSRQLWFWQHQSSYTYAQISRIYKPSQNIPRSPYSHKKLNLAKKIIFHLSRIPTIQAIFITGALAMNNSPELDDIDIMIITSPNALWLTRLLVILYLKSKGLRRNPHLPEHSSLRVSNKICDNLYLDLNHLAIQPARPAGGPSSHNATFLSHEILQAKCLFDRGGIHKRFLLANSWTKNYLPIAYSETMKQYSHSAIQPFSHYWILFPINLFLFAVQYLYMKPKLTSERVGLGYAFFHPRQSLT